MCLLNLKMFITAFCLSLSIMFFVNVHVILVIRLVNRLRISHHESAQKAVVRLGTLNSAREKRRQ